MAWLVFLALVVAVPIGLLVWRRRDGGPGEDGTDPHGNRDLGADGGPPGSSQKDGWGGVGGAL